MKKLLILLLTVIVTKSNAQTKEALFDKTCNQIVTYLAKGQLDGLNKYIQPDIGVYSIYRIGAMDAVAFNKRINIKKHLLFPQYSQAKMINDNSKHVDNDLLKQIQKTVFTQKSKLPKFNCIAEEWSMSGVFTDTNTNNTDRLTTIINIRKSDEPEYRKLSHQTGVQKIESLARKVVITKYNLVLYLYYYNNKWWLGIIDDTEADCSA